MVSYLVMKNNWRRAWNHKALLFLTFLVPIVLCLITGVVNQASKNPALRIGIANMKGLPEQEQQLVFQVLEETEKVQYQQIIKEKYEVDLYRGTYDLVIDYADADRAEEFRLHTIKKEEVEMQMQTALLLGMRSGKKIDFSLTNGERLPAKEQMASFLTMILMVFSVIRLSVLIKDRQDKVMERFLYAPAKKWMYVNGMMGYQIILTLLQSGIIFGILSLFLKNSAFTLKEGAVLTVAITGAATIFAVLVCMLCKSEMSANMTASGIAVILTLLGGTFVPLSSMPKLLQAVSVISPMRMVTELMHLLG